MLISKHDHPRLKAARPPHARPRQDHQGQECEPTLPRGSLTARILAALVRQRRKGRRPCRS
jgi:hypothetical protein